MDNIKEIVQVAVDAYHGNPEKYSVGQSMDMLRAALIEANGGSTQLNIRNIRDGKCSELFTIVEQILDRTVVEGLQGDEYFNTLIEFVNVAQGDKNSFLVEDADLFTVSNAANGTQAIRRQRLGGFNEVSLPTSFHAVKIYEELNRVLAGQVDMNRMIQKVGESFRQEILNDNYKLWETATAKDFGGATYFPAAGAYDEDVLLELIEHVEAASGGKKATIIGTKSALRVLAPSIQGIDSQNDLYHMGYYGNFYGTPTVAMPQRHQLGTSNFIFDNNTLHIIAGDAKPIKFVYEGNPLVIPGDIYKNQDLTQDYMYGVSWGHGIVLAGGNAGVARYKVTR